MVLDNIAFVIFGRPIYWYGLVYFFGFLSFYIYFIHFIKIKNLSKKLCEDFIFYLILFGILGGRIFHIIFYNPIYYIENLQKIFYVWEGGMSIYGGIFFVGIYIYYFTKKHKINFFEITDKICLFFPLFLSLGRITNFLNGELIGKVSKNIFSINGRHPVVLYESFFYFLIFIINFYLSFFTKKIKSGTITFIFIFGYSTIRFIMEFFKESDALQSQIFSVIFFMVGIYLYNKK